VSKIPNLFGYFRAKVPSPRVKDSAKSIVLNLFHFVHHSDFLQHHGSPLSVAWQLVAHVSCGRRGKDGMSLRRNADGATFAEWRGFAITLFNTNCLEIRAKNLEVSEKVPIFAPSEHEF
jgi:hypothetical protein